MKRMACSNVFLSGLGGLGIEIGNVDNIALKHTAHLCAHLQQRM